MGLETALVSLGVGAKTASVISSAASIAGGISSIAGGASANAEAKRQARIAEYQAQQQGAESARLAQREATFTQEEAESTRRAQKVAYLKSGVTLEGSPLLVMESTRARGQDNVNEIFRAGGASTGAAYTEGRLRTQNTRAQGRQAFISGLTGAASLFKSAF